MSVHTTAASKIQRHSGVFHHAGKKIPFYFWSHTDGGPPDTVIFLGAGQIGRIPQWVVRNAGVGVVAVEGLPHWETTTKTEDIAQFCKAYIASALHAVLTTFKLPTIHMIAESQAVPGSVITALTHIDTVQNIALVRPLGFSVQAFGGTEQERFRTFRKRVLQTTLQLARTLLRDPRNIGVGLVMLRAGMREPTITALTQKYIVGISYDLLEECRQLARQQRQKGASLAILLGTDDRLFPATEVRAALTSKGVSNILIEDIPHTTHGSLATRSSKAILRHALRVVRSRQTTM
ncbi:MAG TPA: hypothetical protein VFT58_04450 [Nitrososphaera sp.]|nr:hypothetical protein [Nitrososphaera sp.]